MEMKYIVIDTNLLLEIESIENHINEYKFVILADTLRELEKHKSSTKDRLLAYKARKAVRWIEANNDKVKFDLNDYKVTFGDYEDSYIDNRILQACLSNNYLIATSDLLLKMKCQGFDIETIDLIQDEFNESYTGVYDLYIDNSTSEGQNELAELYSTPEFNKYKLSTNQYLVIWDKSKPTYNEDEVQNGYVLIDQMKWDGEKYTKVKFKNAESRFMGKVSPINYKQKLLFELLQNKNIGIKLCQGNYGTGKDYTMIANLVQMIERGDFEKMIFIRNTEPLDDSRELGFLPGDLQSKMADWMGMVADALGGQDGLQMLIDKGKIEIINFSALRGRSFSNSILYCSEGQNLLSKHMKLIVSRVGKNSELWVNGDTKQTDNRKYDGDSGIRSLYKLKGHRLFGMVTLDKNERSDVASLAELLD